MSKVHRNAYIMLAVLLACMTAIMAIDCQVHATEVAHEQATTSRHHSHDASGHTARVVPCLLAILPFVALLLIFTYVWCHIAGVIWHQVIVAFPLFIPPRHAARSLLASAC
jgi:H+/Cl- antiporter ClcA